MEKSKHEYTSNIIPYEELGNFINPIEFILSINICQLLNNPKNNLILNRNNKMGDLINFLKPKLSSLLPYFGDPNVIITYTPHDYGYDFRVNPIELINDVLYKVNGFLRYKAIDYIPFFNLDSQNGMNDFKKYVKDHLVYKYDLGNSSFINDIFKTVKTNLDSICNLYYLDINSSLKDSFSANDMLFYLAYCSLDTYSKILYKYNVVDERYMVFPYEYYQFISGNRIPDYPHKLCFNDGYKWHDDFRVMYENLVGKNFVLDDSKYRLKTYDNYFVSGIILPPGNVDKTFQNIAEYARSNMGADYKKWQKLFEMKFNFYANSGFINIVECLNGFRGYVGFVYRNDYSLFDKFYNLGGKKNILTHHEAAYALPADRLELICHDKQTVITSSKSDSRIRRVIHNDFFDTNARKIINGANVSTMSFEEGAAKNGIVRKRTI